ncbi:S41 family peptidase [Anaeromyxobacter dehalogenans]|uniref:C-terminal processing peptidase-3, Serine peptidase, MEROPS family S41A n=1 Tax=Anaeromyxobacter dehalogenans (strain 2CP-C) TaxID=290397 RepID=Q2INR3_ANADE|nr:S41 family peptidase [Anaeromyxobacter dehalogenans]ABC80445.1 C-terminal processing peptidase-3, Serine peptidase, MEROPS family S41A [Anaeromyxobacter dehalogenans 2CP-C]
MMRRLALVAVLALAFFAGLVADRSASAARRAASRPYRALDVFADVLGHVESSYLEPVDERELVYGAIDGMMARLDAHSAFMRPEVFEQLRDETTGEFDGLGLEVALEDGVLTVVSPMAESPGERAGLRPGDRILAIDGASTHELGLAGSIRRMKGAPGSQVVLEVDRAGFTAPQRLTLVRERVRTQSVDLRVLDAGRGYLYLRVKAFQERTDRALAKALADGREALGGEIRGLVLDLRNNPGGLLDQAVRVADAFLAEGIIVSTEGRDRREVEVQRARPKGTEPGYPMIVLVNRGTASASEIVAGALQDNGRAVVMGTQTYGKGSVQTIVELEDGSGLKLTVARYYTPRHRSIQELGISPDVVVAETAPAVPAQPPPAERDLKRHLRNEAAPVPASIPAPAAPEDFQLRTALDYLRATDVLRGGPGARGAATAPKRQ